MHMELFENVYFDIFFGFHREQGMNVGTMRLWSLLWSIYNVLFYTVGVSAGPQPLHMEVDLLIRLLLQAETGKYLRIDYIRVGKSEEVEYYF